MADDTKKRIMVIGLSCVDIVTVNDGYPKEDSDQRSVSQRWQRGGNACNSSTVLAILGAHVECFVSIADSHEKTFILEDFAKFNIHSKYAVIHSNCQAPLSIIIVNKQNGSRTILHTNKNLPEVGTEDFKKIDLKAERFSWIHFEARPNHVNETGNMLQLIDQHNSGLAGGGNRIMTSVELEKNRPDFGGLLDKADCVFISKEFAEGRGCYKKEDTVHKLLPSTRPGATLICAWGEDGACGAINNSAQNIISVPIHSPPEVVDTLGAGDSFNAGTIYSLSQGRDLESALRFGCKVAGTKCGMQGFEGLKDFDFTV